MVLIMTNHHVLTTHRTTVRFEHQPYLKRRLLYSAEHFQDFGPNNCYRHLFSYNSNNCFYLRLAFSLPSVNDVDVLFSLIPQHPNPDHSTEIDVCLYTILLCVDRAIKTSRSAQKYLLRWPSNRVALRLLTREVIRQKYDMFQACPFRFPISNATKLVSFCHLIP